MKRQFIDTIIDMKMDECETAIKEVTSRIEILREARACMRIDSATYNETTEEIKGLIAKHTRLKYAKSKLMRVHIQRQMEGLFQDFSSIQEMLGSRTVVKE